MNDYSFAKDLEHRQRSRGAQSAKSWVLIGVFAALIFLMSVRSWPLWTQLLLISLGLVLAFIDYRSTGVRAATRQPVDSPHIAMSGKAVAVMILWFLLSDVMFNLVGDNLAQHSFLIQCIVALGFGVLSSLMFRFIYRDKASRM